MFKLHVSGFVSLASVAHNLKQPNELRHRHKERYDTSSHILCSDVNLQRRTNKNVNYLPPRSQTFSNRSQLNVYRVNFQICAA